MKLLDDFLTTEYAYAREDLGIYRVLYCSVVLGTLPFGLWLAELPAFMFSPPLSPVALLPELPPPPVYIALNVATAVSAVLLLFGICPMSTSLTLSMSMLSIRAFAYSSGKINHDILLPLIPAVLAFSNWGASFRLQRGLDRQTKEGVDDGFPVAILAFLTAFWMATAGWAKLTTDWFRPAYSAVYDHVFGNIHVTGRGTVWGELAIAAFPVWLWEALDWATVLFELSGVLLVWKRSLFRTWLFFACFFHLGIDLFMSIPFSVALLAYGVFVPWRRLPPFRYLSDSSKGPAYLAAAVLAVVVVVNTLPTMSVDRGIVWVAPLVALSFATEQWKASHAQ